MKKSLMAIAAGVATVFCALPAAAQSLSQPQFYVGAGGGRVDTDDDDNSWKLFAGGQFTPNIGIEAAYNDLSTFRGADLTSWSLAGVASVSLNPMWSVFAKLGATANRAENGVSERNTEPLIGAGIGLNFNRNVGVRLEYEDFGKTPFVAGDDARIQNWALSLMYKF